MGASWWALLPSDTAFGEWRSGNFPDQQGFGFWLALRGAGLAVLPGGDRQLGNLPSSLEFLAHTGDCVVAHTKRLGYQPITTLGIVLQFLSNERAFLLLIQVPPGYIQPARMRALFTVRPDTLSIAAAAAFVTPAVGQICPSVFCFNVSSRRNFASFNRFDQAIVALVADLTGARNTAFRCVEHFGGVGV